MDNSWIIPKHYGKITLLALCRNEEKSNYKRETWQRTGYASKVTLRFLSTGIATLKQLSLPPGTPIYILLERRNIHTRKKFFRATLSKRGLLFSDQKDGCWFLQWGQAWRITEEILEGIKKDNRLKLRESGGKTGFDGNNDPRIKYLIWWCAGASYYEFTETVPDMAEGLGGKIGNAKKVEGRCGTNMDRCRFLERKIKQTANGTIKVEGIIIPVSLPARWVKNPPNVNVVR